MKMNRNKRRKVFLVDDDPDVLEFTQELLLNNGFSVVTASSYAESIKKLDQLFSENNFFVVLSDLQLDNGKNGLDIFFYIKKKNIPFFPAFFIYSGYSKNSLLKKIVEEGIFYIPKPFNSSKLIFLIGQEFDKFNEKVGKNLCVDDDENLEFNGKISKNY